MGQLSHPLQAQMFFDPASGQMIPAEWAENPVRDCCLSASASGSAHSQLLTGTYIPHYYYTEYGVPKPEFFWSQLVL